MKRIARLLGTVLLLGASVAVALLISEGFFTLLLQKPGLLRFLPTNTKSHVRRLYLAYDRNMIQAMPCCARFDKELFYTLRPGVFRFRNREFDNEFRVNRLGLRDTEESLHAPKVVVLGDSYAMGWGIDQDKTVAKTLERETGLPTLNAGVSGYGTVREMRLLDRVDLSALRYLVIEYCDDDVLETRPFSAHGNVFEVSDEGRYEEDVLRAKRRTRYFFPRRTLEFFRGILRPESAGFRPATPEEHARLFANALLHAGRSDISQAQLIVFEISQSRMVDGAFALALQREVASKPYPPFIRNLIALDLEGRLKPEHYYDLDDHLREEGQAAVATAVVEAIRGLEARP